jgi:cullin 4
MQECLTRFNEFYRQKHSSRKLDWYHTLGTATLTARFPKGDKELSVSLFQAVVLLLFGNMDDSEGVKLNYEDIRQQTGLSS